MSIYIKESGTWKEITGANRPYAKVSGAWQGMTNAYTKVSGVWQPVYQYDNTVPSVPTPTASANGSSWTVSWDSITDSESGVASATLYQLFYGTTSGFVAGSSYSIPSGSFSGDQRTFSTPTNRRNTGGETWIVCYYIIATDYAGNSSQGSASTNRYTRPYGTFTVTPNSSRSYDSVTPRWFPTDFTDPYDVRAGGTGGYTGLFFYGSKLEDTCKTHEPDNAIMFAQRKGALGYSGTYRFAPCSDGTVPGGAPSVNVYDTIETNSPIFNNTNEGVNIPIINFSTQLSSGNVGSIALITAGVSNTYRQLYPANSGAFNAGGVITLTYN